MKEKSDDSGLTILNNNKKCESKGYSSNLKKQGINGRIPNACEIYSSWHSLSDNWTSQLTQTTEEQKKCVRHLFLKPEIILRDTRGAITWQEVTNQITGNGPSIISYSTL